MSTMDWTPVMVAELTRLWDCGETAVKIGIALGVSKNAVVGKAHRLNLTPRVSPIRQKMVPGTIDQIRELCQAGARRTVIAAKCGIGVPYVRKLEVKHKLPRPQKTKVISLQEVRDNAQALLEPVQRLVPRDRPKAEGCCWPMWGHREPATHVYCGAERPDAGQRYCDEHQAKAFVQVRRLVAA